MNKCSFINNNFKKKRFPLVKLTK